MPGNQTHSSCSHEKYSRPFYLKSGLRLIQTCQLCGINSFDYLIELQRHAQELAANPAEWMPWNYGETIARVGI